MSQLAHVNLAKAQCNQNIWYDLNCRGQQLQPREQVLLYYIAHVDKQTLS